MTDLKECLEAGGLSDVCNRYDVRETTSVNWRVRRTTISYGNGWLGRVNEVWRSSERESEWILWWWPIIGSEGDETRWRLASNYPRIGAVATQPVVDVEAQIK